MSTHRISWNEIRQIIIIIIIISTDTKHLRVTT